MEHLGSICYGQSKSSMLKPTGYKGESVRVLVYKSIDLKISQVVKACQERKERKNQYWKLGKTHTTQSNCNRNEHVSRPGL
eukprot:1153379-Pelagomonas_calceolata.AAC.13